MDNMSLKEYIQNDLLDITLETLYMVGLSGLIATIFALIFGSLLYTLRTNKIKTCQVIYKVLDIIVNIFRSIPFIILILWLVPFTRGVLRLLTGIGTSSGTNAAIVPLAVAAIPFFTKIVENALIEVNKGVVEAAESLGLNKFQIIIKVVLQEAKPAIISGITLGLITLVGYSAMAGYVGGGGIGNFAQLAADRMDNNAKMYAVVTVILFVQIIQLIGNIIYKKYK